MSDLQMGQMTPVLHFLRCRSPAAWIEQALRNKDLLLLDHAALELKAAQQAQRLIWRYGTARPGPADGLSARFRSLLMHKMSRLAREELRHFERVVTLLESRSQPFRGVSASRYASGLHALARAEEPALLVDTLLIGAIIEARSCERFYSLLPGLAETDPELERFYSSLLRSEARHFEDYLALANAVDNEDCATRVEALLARDADLISSPDRQFRFHSGLPQMSSASSTTNSNLRRCSS